MKNSEPIYECENCGHIEYIKDNDIEIDPRVYALLRWRDSLTDCWGDDLISLLYAEFSSDPYILHHNRRSIPKEHEIGLKVLRNLDYDAQHKIIKSFVEDR